MDPERQREIARKGGASVPHDKRSFSQDRNLAAEAGRRGGEASHGARKSAVPELAQEPPRPQDEFSPRRVKTFE